MFWARKYLLKEIIKQLLNSALVWYEDNTFVAVLRVESQVLFKIVHHCVSSLELNAGKIFLISPLPYSAFQG